MNNNSYTPNQSYHKANINYNIKPSNEHNDSSNLQHKKFYNSQKGSYESKYQNKFYGNPSNNPNNSNNPPNPNFNVKPHYFPQDSSSLFLCKYDKFITFSVL